MRASIESNGEFAVLDASGTPPLDAELTSSAFRAGRDWAVNLRETLVSERRAPCGGWPGTITEARARVGIALQCGLAPFAGLVLTSTQREAIARLIYSSARSTWMGVREAEPTDGQTTE